MRYLYVCTKKPDAHARKYQAYATRFRRFELHKLNAISLILHMRGGGDVICARKKAGVRVLLCHPFYCLPTLGLRRGSSCALKAAGVQSAPPLFNPRIGDAKTFGTDCPRGWHFEG